MYRARAGRERVSPTTGPNSPNGPSTPRKTCRLSGWQAGRIITRPVYASSALSERKRTGTVPRRVWRRCSHHGRRSRHHGLPNRHWTGDRSGKPEFHVRWGASTPPARHYARSPPAPGTSPRPSLCGPRCASRTMFECRRLRRVARHTTASAQEWSTAAVIRCPARRGTPRSQVDAPDR